MYIPIGDGQIALVSNIVAIINLADTIKRKSPRSQIVLVNSERLNSDTGAATLGKRVKHSIDSAKRDIHSRSATSRKRRRLSRSRRKAGRVVRKK